MALKELHVRFEMESGRLPPSIDEWIALAQREIRDFWDQHPKKQKSEYVECDFTYAAEAMAACSRLKLIEPLQFVEWGAGFGVVTGIASLLGMRAVGIEAESFLHEAASRLHRLAALETTLWKGNFLPAGAARLRLPDEPSVALQYRIAPAYDVHGSDLHQFGGVFCYAWPGEEHFLKAVFDRYAAPNALLVLYRGPYQIEFYRKK